MALAINTNTASMSALTNLNRTSKPLSDTFARISSGLRITKAADDAAGMGVAENLDAAYRSLRQAMRNSNDGVSVIQTAEGYAGEVGNNLKRMRELAVQSASDTLGPTERGYVDTEFKQIAGEIDRIAASAEFNGVKLADGSAASLDVQVGIRDTANDRITITLGDLTATTLGVDAGSVDVSTAAGAQAALTTLDTAISTVNGYRATFGAAQNQLESAQRSMETYTDNIAGAESRIKDADFAYETAQMSKYQIMQQAGVAVLGQANQINSGAVQLLR
jgi:flagellin